MKTKTRQKWCKLLGMENGTKEEIKSTIQLAAKSAITGATFFAAFFS